MNKQRIGLWVALVIINAVSTVTSLAVASNGDKLSNTSVGTINIRLHIPPRVQIAEPADMHLDWLTLTKQRTKELSSDVCIVTGTPAFQVTVAKNNGAYPAFKLSDGTHELDYSASWIDQNGNKSQFTETEHTVYSQVKVKGNQACVHKGRAGRLASLALNFQKIPDKVDTSAIYVGALTLMVSPE